MFSYVYDEHKFSVRIQLQLSLQTLKMVKNKLRFRLFRMKYVSVGFDQSYVAMLQNDQMLFSGLEEMSMAKRFWNDVKSGRECFCRTDRYLPL